MDLKTHPIKLLFTIFLVFVSFNIMATVTYSEGSSGDIVSSSTFSFSSGYNTIRGDRSIGDLPAFGDSDSFLFSIPVDTMIESISYSFWDPVSYGSFRNLDIQFQIQDVSPPSVGNQDLPSVAFMDYTSWNDVTGVDFFFDSISPLDAGLYEWRDSRASFGGTTATVDYGEWKYEIGFNVISSPVPLPPALALMSLGLGLLRFVATRRGARE